MSTTGRDREDLNTAGSGALEPIGLSRACVKVEAGLKRLGLRLVSLRQRPGGSSAAPVARPIVSVRSVCDR
jgi:hypothetical protein